jgi:hypothetical protein
MSGRLFAKITLSAAIAGAAVLSLSGTSYATSVTGKISAFHLSGDNVGGEACWG